MGELRRRAEGEVHVLPEYLGDVGLGDLHALGKLALIHAEFLHPTKDAAEEGGANVIESSH